MKNTKKIIALAALVFFTINTATANPGYNRQRRRNYPRRHVKKPVEMLGLRVGHDFKNEQMLIGGHFLMPTGVFWRFVPGFDYYLTNDEDPYQRWQFNGDVIFTPRPRGPLYFGGGVAMNYLLPDGAENTTEWGGNALVGMQIGRRRSPLKFYMQARWSFFEQTTLSVVGGVNLALR